MKSSAKTKADRKPGPASHSHSDVLIIGGGLAGGLTALQFHLTRPEVKVILIEEGATLGGHHTWSFHETDLTAQALEMIRPMITRSWTKHTVQFPRLARTLDGGYHSIRSEDFHKYLTDKLGDAIRLNMKIEKVTDSEAEAASGDSFTAGVVLDARGLEALPQPKLNGFQKFIGFDLELEEPHGLSDPILMDATCPQLDGFRFFYVLPWDEKRLLIEETYYSTTPDLNRERISKSVRSYAERHGWKVAKTEREESGVLPIPMTSDYIKTSVTGEPLPIGMRGGYFHATTGYCFPDSVRIAEYLATVGQGDAILNTQTAREGLTRFRRSWVSRQRFYRLLNRLLFYASEPSLRYTVLQRFYEFPQEVVERFYAGRSSWADRLRILSGKSPVPLQKAFRSLTEKSVIERAAPRSDQ